MFVCVWETAPGAVLRFRPSPGFYSYVTRGVLCERTDKRAYGQAVKNNKRNAYVCSNNGFWRGRTRYGESEYRKFTNCLSIRSVCKRGQFFRMQERLVHYVPLVDLRGRLVHGEIQWRRLEGSRRKNALRTRRCFFLDFRSFFPLLGESFSSSG